MAFLTFFTGLVAAVAITIGVLSTPVPKSLGLYRWIAKNVHPPRFVGWLPVFVQDEEWRFTFEQLYSMDLTGQAALVTGANSGTGYETALALAQLGASVTMACRNVQRCEAAAERIRADKLYRERQQSLGHDNSIDGTVNTMILDTSSLKSVQAFAKAYRSNSNSQTLDMLFLNAGIGGAPGGDGAVVLSEDGIELVFATNHVGHHFLYQSLEPLLCKSDMARVVLTSSAGSFHSYDYKVATDLETLNNVSVSSLRDKQLIYGQSKLAQVFFAQEATRRLKLAGHENVYVNAAHPGVVNTAIFDKFAPKLSPLFQKVLAYLQEHAMWTAAEGALTLLYLGVAKDELVSKNIKGKYYHPQSVQVDHPLTQQGGEEVQQKLWQFCDDLVKDFAYVTPEIGLDVPL